MAKHSAPRRHRAPRKRSVGALVAVVALAILVVIAVPVVLIAMTSRTDDAGTTDADEPDGAASTVPSDLDGEAGLTNSPAAAVADPDEGMQRVRVPESGTGEFRVAAAPEREIVGTTYRVEVEGGLPFAPARVAAFVEDTLSDPRSWSAAGHDLTRVDGESDLRILLASPETADSLCAPLDTGGRLSCRSGNNVVINAWRWANGTKGYDGRLTLYRRYVVNHETGHALGYGHASCPGKGEPAPVMLQQTITLAGCTPNWWPAGVDIP